MQVIRTVILKYKLPHSDASYLLGGRHLHCIQCSVVQCTRLTLVRPRLRQSCVALAKRKTRTGFSGRPRYGGILKDICSNVKERGYSFESRGVWGKERIYFVSSGGNLRNGISSESSEVDYKYLM